MDEIMTLEQVAEALGIAPRTLRNRIAARRDHPPFRRSGHQKIFLKKEVMDWLQSLPARTAETPRRRGRPRKAEQVEGWR